MSLIHPYLAYGSEIYLNTYESHRNKLLILQKKAIRAVNCLSYRDHTTNYFKRDNILKLPDLHKFNIAVYLYKTINLGFDDVLFDFIRNSTLSNIHDHFTRNNSLICVPLYSRAYSQSSMNYIGAKLYNSLPTFITNCSSLYKFKSTLRLFYTDSCWLYFWAFRTPSFFLLRYPWLFVRLI